MHLLNIVALLFTGAFDFADGSADAVCCATISCVATPALYTSFEPSSTYPTEADDRFDVFGCLGGAMGEVCHFECYDRKTTALFAGSLQN